MNEYEIRRTAEFFRMHMEKIGIPKTKLVKLSGVSRRLVYNILDATKYDNNPTVNTLIALCEALDTDFTEYAKYIQKK